MQLKKNKQIRQQKKNKQNMQQKKNQRALAQTGTNGHNLGTNGHMAKEEQQKYAAKEQK